jgi:predicted secreted protein
MAEFILTGEENVEAFLLALAKSEPKKLAAALYQVGNEALTASKKRVPVDTGTLKGSGQIDAPKITQNGASIRMGYGDTAVDYALIVHENTEANHPTGQSHYLSSVIDELRPTFSRKVGEQLVFSK